MDECDDDPDVDELLATDNTPEDHDYDSEIQVYDPSEEACLCMCMHTWKHTDDIKWAHVGQKGYMAGHAEAMRPTVCA